MKIIRPEYILPKKEEKAFVLENNIIPDDDIVSKNPEPKDTNNPDNFIDEFLKEEFEYIELKISLGKEQYAQWLKNGGNNWLRKELSNKDNIVIRKDF